MPADRAGVVVKAILAVVIGMLAGGAFNAALGEQGADTPAFALLGGGLALVAVFVWRARRRAGAPLWGRRRQAPEQADED